MADESYVLGRPDLKLAEMIAFDPIDDTEISSEIVVAERRGKAIDGLRLTFTGQRLRELLDERIQGHRRSVEWWEREQNRTPEAQTEEEPLLPDQMCEYEAERHDWRTRVLEFIREHVDPLEVYRLGESDLLFAELLPVKPGSVEQEEFKERTGVAFHLERLTKRLGQLPLGLAMMSTNAERESEIGRQDT